MAQRIVREYVEHRGIKYFRSSFDNSNIEYWYSARGVKEHGGKVTALHRVLYEEAYGAIPVGYQVHHRDGNGLNNALENLQAVTAAEHRAIHGLSGYCLWTKEQHRAEAKRKWAERKPRVIVCPGCNCDFETTAIHAQFCNPKCRRKYYYRERGY